VTRNEGAPAYHLRDRHGASRAVAYLMLAGAPFVLFTGVLLVPGVPLYEAVAITATSLGIGAGGFVCWRWPQVMPDYFWLLAPVLATTLITGMNLATRDASTGAQLFYLWPVLYAANFVSRRAVYYNVAYVVAGDAVVVFSLLDTGRAMADVASLTLAMTMSAVVVVPLRERADQLRRRLEQQALADPLTGLGNRRSFDEELRAAGDWARRGDRSVALVTVDVDHFKHINDTWGHAVGDQALQLLGAALREVAGPDDVVARLGGDEFVMVVRGDEPHAVRTAEALRASVATITTLPGGPPGLSIGVAVLPDHAATVAELVRASDAALYEAKSRGRDQVAVAARHNVERPGLRPVRRPPDRAASSR
jgi:diguanylate cyclase (GGDEF)-like protein